MSCFDIGIIIRDTLLDDAVVADIVGERIYPNRLPEDTSFDLGTPDLPALYYQMVDCSEQDAADIYYSHWYVYAVAKQQLTLNELCGAVNGALNKFKSGNIRFMGLSDSSMEYDDETQTPYCVMTYQVTFF